MHDGHNAGYFIKFKLFSHISIIYRGIMAHTHTRNVGSECMECRKKFPFYRRKVSQLLHTLTQVMLIIKN